MPQEAADRDAVIQSLTRRQREAYRLLTLGNHLWPKGPAWMGGNLGPAFSKRTLEALRSAGLAHCVISRPGSGVLPYYTLRRTA